MQGFTVAACKIGMRSVYRIDAAEMAKVPREGPLIAYTNHTGLAEAPILYTHLKPRKHVTGIAKAEFWDNWFMRWIFTLWELIPVHRGEADMEAMRVSIDALKRGYILGIAPEGTRNKTGKLIRAQPGIAILALHSGALLQPVAHTMEGSLGENLKRFRRTPFKVRVGRVFKIDLRDRKVTKEARQEIADEIMYQLAKLLPEENRGAYADLGKATENWLAFQD
ncbi:MAG: 1-acyl-sn-glycerol-3-phosphate acyltransferase [Spirochaetaceae bacterium]|nr:1-acyl-sn-glycerol-3-phosphate acyltransferase [Spirochaetaceae bacterium]